MTLRSIPWPPSAGRPKGSSGQITWPDAGGGPMERTTIEGIDLNDPERFVRLEHHEMFTKLRAEDPVHWQEDDLKGGGYWNVVKHADLIEVNRDTATFSSEIGGTMIMSGQYPVGEDPDTMIDTRGVLMLDMDPPKHTRYRLLVNKGFTPRMIGLIEQALRHRASLIVDNVIESGRARLRGGRRRRAPAPGDRRDHGRPAGGPPQAVRVVEPHGRRRRPRVHGRRHRRRVRRAVHLRQRARGRAAHRSRTTTSSPSS